MSFRHKAFYGATGTGKTWLIKRIIKILLKNKQIVLIYSGVADTFPKGAKVFYDADSFEAALADRSNFGAHVFIDEGAVLYDEAIPKKDYPNIHFLFQKGRHKGFTAYITTQYPTSIPRKVRVNCQECYCFRLGDEESANLVYKDYSRLNYDGQPLNRAITNLPAKLECLHIVSPDFVEKISL